MERKFNRGDEGRRRQAALIFVTGLAAAFSLLLLQENARAGGTAEVRIGDRKLKVEVADTIPERLLGLMYRDKLGEERGMLFIFEEPTDIGFWMKNTRIPLSIAFIDEEMRIIDIQDMEPNDPTSHKPPGPYRYSLEVNQGWFQKNGVKVGDRVEIKMD